MKLLFCQDCAGLVVPLDEKNQPTRCGCRRHAVWWSDPVTGELRVFDALTKFSEIRSGRYHPRPRAYVIGLTNALLSCEQEALDAQAIQELIDLHPDNYMFKRVRSLVVRFRPGESGDTAWGELP